MLYNRLLCRCHWRRFHLYHALIVVHITNNTSAAVRLQNNRHITITNNILIFAIIKYSISFCISILIIIDIWLLRREMITASPFHHIKEFWCRQTSIGSIIIAFLSLAEMIPYVRQQGLIYLPARWRMRSRPLLFYIMPYFYDINTPCQYRFITIFSNGLLLSHTACQILTRIAFSAASLASAKVLVTRKFLTLMYIFIKMCWEYSNKASGRNGILLYHDKASYYTASL